MAERTGCPVFLNLWSYVEYIQLNKNILSKNDRWKVNERPMLEGKQVAKRRNLGNQDGIVKEESILPAIYVRFWAIEGY